MTLTEKRPMSEEERRVRKREQNRRNQMARRDRMRDQRNADPTQTTRPFSVQRWRPSGDMPASGAAPQQSSERAQVVAPAPNKEVSHRHLKSAARPDQSAPEPDTTSHIVTYQPPLPVDHTLIQLISYNVCRGISSNKAAIGTLMTTTFVVRETPTAQTIYVECGFAVIHPVRAAIPPGLLPTRTQMATPHPTWIDSIPFPKVRDNLIRRQSMFDHRDFLRDLVGDLELLSLCGQAKNQPSSSGSNGLILWGEPHLGESWEATPEFLAKWAWAFTDCHEIFDASNRWRQTRGEEVLPVICF